MTEKNPDNPFPESDDNPSFEDVSSLDENEVTVILPDEVGEELTEDVPEPPESEQGTSGEVFVLLPDGEDSEIPMVDTEELTDDDVADDVTEEVSTDSVAAPRLTSVYEATTASQVGLRTDNPAQEQTPGADTEIDPLAEPTEDAMVVDHPTEAMSAGDLDDFANEVADDMLVAEGGESSPDEEPIDYADEDDYDPDEPAYDDEETYSHIGEKRSSFKKVVLSFAALIAIAALGVQFFPGYVGLDPSFDLTEFVMSSFTSGPEVASSVDPVIPPDGGGSDEPDSGGSSNQPLAMAAREMFKSKFRQAIELGFGEVPR